MNDDFNRTPQTPQQDDALHTGDRVHATDDAVVEAVRNKLKQQLVERLPGGLQARMEENLPGIQRTLREVSHGAKEFLGPLWAEARVIFAGVSRKLASSAVTHSIGSTFRHICFVGLNKSELLLQGEVQSVFNDGWADQISDNMKRHTALLFFAPRGLDGKPVNPYLFLMGEGVPDEEDMVDPNAVALAEQQVGPVALLDLCRISKSEPNTVNMLLVADTLFHWDVKDNYVLPTTPTSWVRDVEQVMKTYPRTTRAHLYTQWDTDLLPPSDRITVHHVRDMPLDDNTWLNKPTLQERYGSHVMFAGIIIAILTYVGLWYQGQQLQELSDQLSVIEQQIPRGGQFSDLERAITEQERMWRKRDLFPLVVKDTARAIQKSGMQVKQFKVEVPSSDQPPRTYMVEVEAKSDVYQGWLQQEPIARSLILNSAVMDAIRKPATTMGFKLEGLVDANALEREYRPFASKVNKAALQASPTTPKPEGENAGGND